MIRFSRSNSGSIDPVSIAIVTSEADSPGRTGVEIEFFLFLKVASQAVTAHSHTGLRGLIRKKVGKKVGIENYKNDVLMRKNDEQ